MAAALVRPERPLAPDDMSEPTAHVHELLTEIDADPTGIFWARRTSRRGLAPTAGRTRYGGGHPPGAVATYPRQRIELSRRQGGLTSTRKP